MKRLITCTDGTWDRPGITDRGKPVKSNVELIYNSIAAEDENGIRQLKVYETGVGSSTFSIKDKLLGGAAGQGLDKKIKDIYTFLVLNYNTGDEIYLFGFSRGAYTARSLAGFIRNCGILKPEYLNYIDRAYELYRDRNEYTWPDSDLMTSFRRNYCFELVTRIKFLGVWDTVGSLGIPLPWYNRYNMERYKFHDVTLSSTVDNAYHALAVDERRSLFQPSLWKLSNTVKCGMQAQKMEQRWFAGVHCNIGGGYINRGLSDLALLWLVEKSKESGLNFLSDQIQNLHPSFRGELRNSRTFFYHLWKAKWREILKNGNTNEVIDNSVFKRYKADPAYRPQNLKGKVPDEYLS